MYNKNKRDFTPINHQIRSRQVLVIDQDNNNLGLLQIENAIKMALDAGLDLVQVSPGGRNSSPTCKILDYGKYKYQQSKNEKAAAKKQRENSVKIKEIKFRPTTDINDLRTKASKVQEFLNDGDKVKITIAFRGREVSHKEIAFSTLNTFLSLIPDLQLIESPSMNGKILSALGQKKNDTKIEAAE